MKEETVKVSYRFPKSLLNKLRKQAAAEYTTVTSLIIRALAGKKNGKQA